MSSRFGLWFATTMVGVIVFGIYAVLRVDPAAHDPSLSPLQWVWTSYGNFIRGGFLLGGLAGVFVAWLVPRRAER